MLKRWLAALSGALVVGTGPALSQTPSEATRWLVPLNIAGNNAETAKAARVFAYNVGARPARVVVVTMLNGEKRYGEQILLQPGRSVSFPEITNPANFAVVVADEPVVASATIDRVTTRVQTPFKVVEPTDPGQITLQNQQNNQFLRGNFMPYTTINREDVLALPIACQGAPDGHFACSIRFQLQTGDNAAPRPIENATTAPPPRAPEPRITRTPEPDSTRRPEIFDRPTRPSRTPQ